MQTKYIIVTGGVLSGLGKGIATASIARLLKNNKKIVTIKCDGYLNVDPGTMNPIEHGEVFVLADGGEVDMDFGHYERFLGITCKSEWNLTSGKIFNRVVANEREGKYLGKTIQIFPHITEEIKEWWKTLQKTENADIMTIEIGGTVGDIENSWFVEAARQLKKQVGSQNVAYIHLTYVPFFETVGEPKTKPAQRDIALLREKGITPDIVICRSKNALPKKIKEKISLFCDIEENNIITGKDINCIYEVPILFKEEGILERLKEKLKIETEGDLTEWTKLVQNIKTPKNQTTIAICGKYTELKDSYASIIEALTHAGAHCNTKVNLKWIETTDIETVKQKVEDALKGVDGVLIPGGFGSRGVEGKISIIKHIRENNIPFLGICYGLQLAVIEFARNVCKLEGAHSIEIDEKTKHPVIDYIPEQRNIKSKGGTMRLGGCTAVLQKGTKVQALYNADTALERHRHRYEVNPAYHEQLTKNGMIFSGMSENKQLVEYIELEKHPFFVATQAHNELTSKLEKPNPLFLGFVHASLNKTFKNQS
ncbi:CTP synthase (glutamine hydrolyzing) [Candidatus Woesearchaeota archaeon]|nr:CTP synthase (glutamine hydrolyzing) [Candidatus Woesearchaeota archaeon]